MKPVPHIPLFRNQIFNPPQIFRVCYLPWVPFLKRSILIKTYNDSNNITYIYMFLLAWIVYLSKLTLTITIDL